jgi:hypothetical protein
VLTSDTGDCYLFSARQDGKRVATIEVQRINGSVSIAQMRGPCNAVLTKPTQDLLRRWCRQRNAWADPALTEQPEHPMLYFLRPGRMLAAMPEGDDGIPF